MDHLRGHKMSQDRADIQEIKGLIPHRYPFLMIDAVEQIVPNETAVGIKNVTINEPHFQGHFPQQPVMPGVMIVEAIHCLDDHLSLIHI